MGRNAEPSSRAAKRFAVPCEAWVRCCRLFAAIMSAGMERAIRMGWLAKIFPCWRAFCKCADIYDALTTERPYKTALSPEEAFAVMEEEVRRGWRDPELVPLFASTIQTNPSCGPHLARSVARKHAHRGFPVSL